MPTVGGFRRSLDGLAANGTVAGGGGCSTPAGVCGWSITVFCECSIPPPFGALALCFLWRNLDAVPAREIWLEGLARFGADANACAQALQAVGAGQYFEAGNPSVETIRQMLNR